ncbi:MAG: hypothetical protein V1921_05825 [Candidatus Altiarchaeota archaeon]
MVGFLVRNFKGGFCGVAFTFLVYLLMFLLGFFAAFGTEGSTSKAVLQMVETFYNLKIVILLILVSYTLGALLEFRCRNNHSNAPKH